MATIIAEDTIGSWGAVCEICRRSCAWENRWISVPAQIKRRALNSAWVIKWKKARLGRPMAKVEIITPNWLRVDRAIIFFKSHSTIALAPAINIVIEAI